MSSLMIKFAELIVILLLVGCSGSGSSPAPDKQPQRGELVSSTSAAPISVGVVNAYITALAGLGVDTSALSGKTKYEISLHRIVYKTVAPDGRLINASGVLAYPLKAANVSSPIFSYQHGTIFVDADAPSNVTSSNYDPLMIALAGSGFVMLLPDYIGYTSSTDEIHTYLHAQGLAASIVDMMRAARTLLAKNNVKVNGQVFLSGYSEGGYATLAAHKEIEQKLTGEFTLTASLPAAGPYDISATLKYMVGVTTNNFPQFLGFVIKSYDYWYGWKRLSTIFQNPYDTVVANYYDGSNSGTVIQSALTTTMSGLFNPTFRSSFLSGGETQLKANIAQNDIYNWRANTPTRLFHGQDDNVVPYFNTSNAIAGMTAAGSTSVTAVNCSTPAPGSRGHSECIWDYFSQVVGWFVPLASDL